jgi:hypothetical protein
MGFWSTGPREWKFVESIFSRFSIITIYISRNCFPNPVEGENILKTFPANDI